VATDEGRIVASHVLMAGPGDHFSVVFALQKPTRRYYVYFGNPDPAPPPQGTGDVSYHCGMLLEERVFAGGAFNNAREMEICWERSHTVLGRTMVSSPYLGFNPINDRNDVFFKLSGSLLVPADGQYLFAGAAERRAVLYIDSKLVLFMPHLTGEVRYTTTQDLKKGRHDIDVLYACAGSDDMRLSVVWQPPGQSKVEILSHDALGQLGHCTVGPMEERNQMLLADFHAEYTGECFFSDHYSYRYQFEALASKAILENAKFNWDFGDGQMAAGPNPEHVFLTDGEYPIKLTIHVGANSDAQTTRFYVCRDRQKIMHPPTDEPPVHSKMVTEYDLSTAPATYLPWVIFLHDHANAMAPMLHAADALVRLPNQPEPGRAIEALNTASQKALESGNVRAAIAVWNAAPANSNIKPQAVRREAPLLLWHAGDFAQALKILEPFATSKDPALRRLYAQALVLEQKAKEGSAILEQLPIDGKPQRQAALSGAMAFSVEAYINSNQAEAGQEAWDQWQAKYPAEFLQGYGVVLETRLMVLRKEPDAAARLAEAFAQAIPTSSYAPQLLDRASRLLGKSNPEKSKALRDLLKQRYPEDPLSQDKP
jgi:hypothetical protein